MDEVKEDDDAGNIKCPLIFQNLNFKDFLIYGTNDDYVKIRSFPYMNLISSIKPFEGQEIKCLELSTDKRFYYIRSHKEKIAVIKDVMKEDNEDLEKKLNESNIQFEIL